MARGNPALNRAAQEYGVDLGQNRTATTPTTEVLNEMFNTPGAGTGRLTVDDVIVKTGICFVFLVAGAFIGWFATPTMPWLIFVSMLAGFALSLVNIFMKKINPILVIAYAFFQGIFLGAVSYMYNEAAVANQYPGIVQQAVIGTLVAFGTMLVLYKTGIIKVSARSRKIFLIALVSYALIGLASLISALFGFGGGWGFYGVGGLGIALCAIGVGLAAYSLVQDFDIINQVVAAGAPERESWRLAFGLLVTLIWLYLEILRLLAILNRR
jgi:uncharacterized YccA/Bax inhibitor family protein